MSLNAHQIEIFLTVANSRSISAAARELYISQPAVSFAIAEMERALGIALFTRGNRGSELTAHGRRIYAELDPVYKRFSIAANRILSKKNAPFGDALSIGAFHEPDVIRFMLASVEKYSEQNPLLAVSTEYFNYGELLDKLLCEELDVAFTFSFEVEGNPDLSSRQVRALKQYFVIPAAYCDIDGSDFLFLRDKPLILEVSSGRETMLNICRAHGFEPDRIKYVNSYLLLANMIAAGEGFTIGGRNLPKLSMLKPQVAFVPVMVFDSNECIHLAAAWRRGDERPAVQKFVTLLETPGLLHAADSMREIPDSKWYR